MVNRGEEKVWVQMNVVPRSTGNTNSGSGSLFPFTRANAQWVIHGFKVASVFIS